MGRGSRQHSDASAAMTADDLRDTLRHRGRAVTPGDRPAWDQTNAATSAPPIPPMWGEDENGLLHDRDWHVISGHLARGNGTWQVAYPRADIIELLLALEYSDSLGDQRALKLRDRLLTDGGLDTTTGEPLGLDDWRSTLPDVHTYAFDAEDAEMMLTALDDVYRNEQNDTAGALACRLLGKPLPARA